MEKPRRTEPKLIAIRKGSGSGYDHWKKSKPSSGTYVQGWKEPRRKKGGRVTLKDIGKGTWKGVLGTADLTAKLAPILVPLALKYMSKGAGNRRKCGGQLSLATPNAGESLVSRSRSTIVPSPHFVTKGGGSFRPNTTNMRGSSSAMIRGYY